MMKRALAMALLCAASSDALSLTRVISRRTALGAAAAVAIAPRPAFADGMKAAALYQEEDHNAVGDAANYLPRIKVNAKGASNSLLAVTVPSPGPKSKGDFVDCMWFMDSRTFKVVAAENFGSNGLIKDKSMQADTGVDPSFASRIKAGTEVVPFIHCDKGGTWEGAPFSVK